jgi:hypothetical protein
MIKNDTMARKARPRPSEAGVFVSSNQAEIADRQTPRSWLSFVVEGGYRSRGRVALPRQSVTATFGWKDYFARGGRVSWQAKCIVETEQMC